MKYGLIGEKLGHSFSQEIHGRIADYEYELCEVARDEVDAFFENADFWGVNVTIPYKKTVISHLDYIDPAAEMIGAVNTVVNRGGKLYGYNTDFSGMRALIRHANINTDGKKVAILGTGATSRTAEAVAKSMEAREIIKVSHSGSAGAISYNELYEKHRDTEVIINTTPVGMYPNQNEFSVHPGRFGNLSGMVDVIYNPLRTHAVIEAESMSIPAVGGLYMLVAQAVAAAELFLDTELDASLTDKIYRELYRDKENIVLTGMPSSGKSTIGRELAQRLGKKLIDTDEEIARSIQMSISEFFSRYGEAKFRDLESEVIERAARENGAVISTGGGAVLRKSNVAALKQNGKIYFLNRSPELLIPTSDRPLSQSREAIYQRYSERFSIYKEAADVMIDADGEVNEIAEGIIENRR